MNQFVTTDISLTWFRHRDHCLMSTVCTKENGSNCQTERVTVFSIRTLFGIDYSYYSLNQETLPLRNITRCKDFYEP